MYLLYVCLKCPFCVLFKDHVPKYKCRDKMIKALERILQSKNVYKRKKFSGFIVAISASGFKHVADSLTEAFNKEGLNHLITGQFPKVRIRFFLKFILTVFFWHCVQ